MSAGVKFFVGLFELFLTSWVVMLLAGALGASVDWGTLSFWQSLGSVYLFKTLISTATFTFINTVSAHSRNSL